MALVLKGIHIAQWASCRCTEVFYYNKKSNQIIENDDDDTIVVPDFIFILSLNKSKIGL